MTIYYALALVTATLNISVPAPSPKHPHYYSIAGCTAVFISPNELLTAGHCVAESRGRQWVKTYEGTTYTATILKIDKVRDLALIKIDKPINHVYTSLGPPVERGQDIYTVNSGEWMQNTYNVGIVNNIIIDEDEGNTLNIVHSAVILPGASGSGLFNSKKQLVGINTATLKGLSEATDIKEIRIFLDKRK